jgi:hypothetical protein
MRSLDSRPAHEPTVVPSEIIGQNEDNIRTLGRVRRKCEDKQERDDV